MNAIFGWFVTILLLPGYEPPFPPDPPIPHGNCFITFEYAIEAERYGDIDYATWSYERILFYHPHDYATTYNLSRIYLNRGWEYEMFEWEGYALLQTIKDSPEAEQDIQFWTLQVVASLIVDDFKSALEAINCCIEFGVDNENIQQLKQEVEESLRYMK